jgi:hypothetical protein
LPVALRVAFAAVLRPSLGRAAPERPEIRGLVAFLVALPVATCAAAPPALAAAAVGPQPVPVVVAVDTSRSLSPAELDAAVERLGGALRALPADTPAGLLAFDDRPRWVRPLGAAPAEVAAALGELRPAGSFTVLHDALFAAARALPEGGVVVVATDGRDENSATTIDDIARRAEEQGVRILTLGAGARQEERRLRRLALITDGAYLGAAEAVPAAEIARAVETAREGVSAGRAAAAAGPAAGGAAGARGAAGEAEARPAGGGGAAGGSREADRAAGAGGAEPGPSLPALLVWLLAAAVLAVLAVVLALAVVRGRRRRAEAAAEAAAAEEEVAAAAAGRTAPPAIPRAFAESLAARETAPAGSAEEVTVDTAVVGGDPDSTLEQTRVLAERAVLMISEPGNGVPRTFLLRADRAFAVGRDRGRNTLALPDPSLSAQHFKVVPDEGRFFLLDLRSTNGTFVNGERAEIRELASGDVIHAGQLECSFRSFAHAVG